MKKWIAIPLVVFASFALVFPTTITVLAKSKNTCVTLYEHINYKGRSITLCGDVKKLSKYNFNDKASSVKVSKSGEGVILFQHVNFKGKHIFLNPGSKISNFKKIKGLNDDISSVNIVG
ncbi:beta/gamma crystallin-related protein [Shimazuella alba]|uniref:Beta/gamma crystallin 'Greek key' domain-containing protein n=1 Tax=Shimazuella alba TaxID=2690964 RepID=A0A6I4W0C2_9BACL|nr:beta/gamma crystallin-related protein [Shimazuella alba]MXQ54144.1 hypothetical protein [Shimazuella alba]